MSKDLRRTPSLFRALLPTCAFLGAFFTMSAGLTLAAPTDIVSDSSTLRDSLGRLAVDGLLPVDASSLLLDRVLTRQQAADLLVKGLGLTPTSSSIKVNTNDVEVAKNALLALRTELLAGGIPVDTLVKSLPDHSESFLGLIQPEARIDTGGKNNEGSGTFGIYRGTSIGDVGENLIYAVSVSNQAEDDRRVFFNDIGPHDNTALTQAYVQYDGPRGLSLLAGRTDENWGPGAEGGALLSDNGSSIDQVRVALPFSLGQRLGRNWNYTQLAGTYVSDNTRIYLQARRIEINFSNKWSAQYEEALKSNTGSMLFRAPLPFLVAKSIHLSDAESKTEFVSDLGLQYVPNKVVRTYGQLLINDIKSPFTGHFLGFDVGDPNYSPPQRLAYLFGASAQLTEGTSATIEYSVADPATYLDKNPQLAWTAGAYDNLGLPSGANAKVLYGLITQPVTKKVTLYLQGRQRKRLDNSYPSPDSQDIDASAKYQFDRRNSVGVTYHDYFQDAFPIAPGAPGYPQGNGNEPVSEANPGTSTTIHEIDVAYTVVF